MDGINLRDTTLNYDNIKQNSKNSNRNSYIGDV